MIAFDEAFHRLAEFLVQSKLGDRNESLDIVAQIHYDPLVQETNDVTLCFRSRLISLCELVPWIVIHLLEAKRDSLLVRVDAQDDDIDLLALAQDLGRVLHAPGPAHIRNVNQAIDPGLDFDECTKRREVPDNAADLGPLRILRRQSQPRIFLSLLHAERDLLLFLVDPQHDALDLIVDRRKLRGVPDVTGPAHLRDVNEALDTLLQLDEGTVVGNRDYPSADPASDRILRSDVLPWIGLQLFEPERDSLAVPINVEDLDLEIVADLTELGWVSDSTPRHVGDVEKTVHPSQIDEGAEVRNVLYDTFANLTHFELGLERVPLRRTLFLENHPPAHDDISTPLVELQDLEFVLLADQLVDVRDSAKSDL